MGPISGFSQAAVRKTPIIVATIVLTLLFVSPTGAQNPFLSKPEKRHKSPESTASQPGVQGKLFQKLMTWQQTLRQRMTALVREARQTGSMHPLAVLVMAAFAYGAVHAAGPGHGKAIAFSYILSQRPTWPQALLFSNVLALLHGGMGILFVLAVRMILGFGMVKNLENVTRITQIVSFGLITCLGLWIFIKSLKALMERRTSRQTNAADNAKRRFTGSILSGAAVGMVPCPGVVMVMLFSLSMDLIVLGILLGAAITIGMALTISIVVVTTLSAKRVSVAAVSKYGILATYVEPSIEILAGLALTVLGALFLGANV